MSEVSDPLRSVVFEIAEGEGDLGVGTEVVWADPLAGSLFKLRNTPVYATGYSFGDVVDTETRDDRVYVTHAVERSGHSGFRIYALDGQECARATAILQEFGGVIFGSNLPTLFAVHIPRDVPLCPILSWLETTLSKDDTESFDYEPLFIASGHAHEVLAQRGADTPNWLREYL